MRTILGREPAYFMSLVAAAIAMATGFGLPLTVDQQGVLNAGVAALFGVVTAWQLSGEKAVAALVGVGKAGIAVALAFGYALSPEVQSSSMLFVEVLLTGFLVRPNVSAPVSAVGVRVVPDRR